MPLMVIKFLTFVGKPKRSWYYVVKYKHKHESTLKMATKSRSKATPRPKSSAKVVTNKKNSGASSWLNKNGQDR